MPPTHTFRWSVLFLTAVVPSLSVAAQVPSADDPPVVLTSTLSPREQKQRESLYLYARGLLYEREDQVLEALKLYEKAAELDPAAAAVYRAMVPLYLALERNADALTASRKVLELDPGDYAVAYLYARQLRDAGKTAEARQALQQVLSMPCLKDHPEVAQQIHVDLGTLHELAEEAVPAAEAYLRAAKILDHPDPFLENGLLTRAMIAKRSAELHERAGKLYMRAKKYDESAAAFRRAQQCDPDGAGRLNLNLAQICLEQDRVRESLAFVEVYLRMQPQSPEAYELKIALLKKLNREADIQPWLELACKADPFNQGLKLVVAKSQARSRPAEAEKTLLELAAANPTPELYAALFQVYRDVNSTTRGLALLDKTVEEARMRPPVPGRGGQAKAMIFALRLDPALSRDLIKVSAQPNAAELQPDTLLLLAGLADHHQQTADAEALYRRCLKNVSAENEPLVYGSLLRLLWKARKTDDVVQLCRDALATARPANHVLLYNDLAKALARQGKHEEALAAANRALAAAAEPDRFALRCLRVRLMVMAEQRDRAEAECAAMLKEFPQPGETMETRYLLSSLYSMARDFDKAVEQLQLILKIDPNNATVCNDLGYIWADQNKNLPEAETLIRKALELDRRHRQAPSLTPRDRDYDNASYLDSLGWVLFRRGQVDAARQELERAAALPDGEDPVIFEHLGDVYYHLNQPARARFAWQRALQLHEQDRSRPVDDRYRELQRKIKAVGGETP
jgi:tetratricopeptide (TPR) repeat protein